MRLLTKSDALAELAQHKRELLREPSECVMCALAEGRDRMLVIAQEPAGSVVLDRFGNRAGHLLVIGRRHVARGTELGWPEYSELQRLAYQACQALESLLSPLRVYVAALGSQQELPMTYAHYHLHVVPVAEEGERGRPAQVFSWNEGVVTYTDAEAAELVTDVKRAWPA